jgi:SNF2 family DNA or RNA helicase
MYKLTKDINSLSILIDIKEFEESYRNSNIIFYDDGELIVTPKRINILFLSNGVDKFIKKDKYFIKVAKRNPNKFNIVNKNSKKSIYESTYKDSVLNRPFFLKEIFLSSLQFKGYQKAGIKWLKESNSRLLADDMGLGKTLQAISAASSLIVEGKIKSVLIVCPTSLVYNWCFEINKWLPSFSVSQITNTGPGRKQNEAWEVIYNSAHFIVTSYDHVRSLPEVIQREKIDLLIVDEAHKLRKSTSKIHKSIRSINATRFWALTGTPIEKNTNDLINILTLIDKKINRLTLKNLHDVMLSSFTEDYFLRRMKKDVLKDMKGYQETKHFLELNKKQMATYRLYEIEFCKSSDNNRLKLFGELKQICDFDTKTLSSSKIDYSLELIEKILSNKEKCVIFSFWLAPLHELKNRLDKIYNKDFSITFDGSLDKQEREKALIKFKTDSNCSVLLCSGKIGGEGINLTEANHIIFINNWWNPSNNRQARDRIVRIGQKRECHIHNLRTANTIESRLDEILDEKNEITETVIDKLVHTIEKEKKHASA